MFFTQTEETRGSGVKDILVASIADQPSILRIMSHEDDALPKSSIKALQGRYFKKVNSSPDELIQKTAITFQLNWCDLYMFENRTTSCYSFIVTTLCQIW